MSDNRGRSGNRGANRAGGQGSNQGGNRGSGQGGGQGSNRGGPRSQQGGGSSSQSYQGSQQGGNRSRGGSEGPRGGRGGQARGSYLPATQGNYAGGSGYRGRSDQALPYRGQDQVPERIDTATAVTLNIRQRARSQSSGATSRPAKLDPGPVTFSHLSHPPDEEATKIEQALVKKPRDAKKFELPRRKDYGTEGEQTIVFANYFRIYASRDQDGDSGDPIFYRYSFSVMSGPNLPRPRKRELVRRVLQLPLFEDNFPATDFEGIIITPKQLDLGKNDAYDTEIDFRDADEIERKPNEPRNFRYRIAPSGVFRLQDLLRYLKSGDPDTIYQYKEEMIQVLNIVFGFMATHNRHHVYQIGPTNKFYYDHVQNGSNFPLGNGLRGLTGFIASVRPATGRLLLNLNVVRGAFWRPIQLSHLAFEFLHDEHYKSNKLPAYEARLPSQATMREMERQFRLLRVETFHQKVLGPDKKPVKDANGQDQILKRFKAVVGFSPKFTNTRETFFTLTNSDTGAVSRVSVYDHFVNTYPDCRRFLDQKQVWPPANLGTRDRPVYVPFELCIVRAGQPIRRLLEPHQTANMIAGAVQKPNQNAYQIVNTGLSLYKLRDENQQTNSICHFDLNVYSNLLKVKARIMRPPQPQYERRAINVSNGSWNLSNVKFYKPGTLGKCCFIMVKDKPIRDHEYLQDPQAAAVELARSLAGYGMNRVQFGHMRAIIRQDRLRITAVPEEIARIFAELKQGGYTFAVFVLPAADRWLYSRIKYFGDLKFGIHTICTVGTKWTRQGKFSPQYIGNLALKFNMKCGGVNHVLSNWDRMDLNFSTTRTMLIGIDCSHPPPGGNTTKATPSISAVVANRDRMLTQWPCSIRRQEGRKEMVTSLSDMVVERLRCFEKWNNKLPEQVIVYRDGVSEGQLPVVLREELPAIREAFERMYKDGAKHPKLAIVVVSKRHHTRFYPSDEGKYDDRTFNNLPGTIVDRGVTDLAINDFFLQSHAALQGTARPARYIVLYDELNMGADSIQRFTHQLCHMFPRATKAISVCPPAYLADRACERARYWLYSTLIAPEGGADDRRDDGGISEWNDEEVHGDLTDSTFYI